MELGTGLEAGGIFSSASSDEEAWVAGPTVDEDQGDGDDDGSTVSIRQLLMEFQINGGNSWAQCRCHGLKIGSDGVQMVYLGVSNMDAALNGGWAEVNLPPVQRRRSPS